MIVTCESCGTKFRIDPSRVKKDTVKVRCSKCSYIFTISLRAPEEEPKKSEKVIVLDDSFEEDVEKVAGRFTASPETSHEEQKEDQVMDDVSEDYSGEAYKKKATTPRKSPPLAISKIVAVGVAVLIIIGFIGYKYYSKRSFQPATTPQSETVTVKINPQTQAFFIENVQVGQILVVQGEVINNSSSSVSFILLEGKVIGTNGKLLLSQRFYAGNTMTKEELAQLTIDKIQERMMRREGNSLSNVKVKPGDKVPFMVVFYNLPPIDDMSDYTVEFVSAELEKSSTTQGGAVKGQSQ